MKSFLLILAVLAVCFFMIYTLPRLSRALVLLPSSPNSHVPLPVSQAEGIASSVMVEETSIPQAGAFAPPSAQEAVPVAMYPGLSEFTAQVAFGQADLLVGVYVPGVFALPVQQQPSGKAEYVTTDTNVLTQFSLASRYGSTGILAHNYLSGSLFNGISEAQDVVLVYGDGRTEQYRVTAIERYQALSPDSPFSQFINLSDPEQKVLSSSELFTRMYTNPDQLIFQTCIQSGEEPSWGRLFIIATPVVQAAPGLPLVGEFLSNN